MSTTSSDGIGGRLDPQQRCAGERRPDRRVVRRHEPHLDPAWLESPLGEGAHRVVPVARQNQDVTGMQRREQHGGDRGHSRGERHRLTALEVADRPLPAAPGRVRVAPVERLAALRRVAGEMKRRGEHRAREERGALTHRREPRVHARGAARARVGAVAVGLGPGAPAAAEHERALLRQRQRRPLRVGERHGPRDLVRPVLPDLDDDVLRLLGHLRSIGCSAVLQPM